MVAGCGGLRLRNRGRRGRRGKRYESELAAYFYTHDVGRMFRVLERLEYGIVGVNPGLISTELAPFGSVKESGTHARGRTTASWSSPSSNTLASAGWGFEGHAGTGDMTVAAAATSPRVERRPGRYAESFTVVFLARPLARTSDPVSRAISNRGRQGRQYGRAAFSTGRDDTVHAPEPGSPSRSASSVSQRECVRRCSAILAIWPRPRSTLQPWEASIVA